MKFSRLAIFVTFSAFATCAFAQHPIPDFSKWNRVEDYTGSYLLKGVPVEIRDVLYEFDNPEKIEFSTIVEFYNPGGKAWFAIYLHAYINQQKVEIYLYEADKNGKWVFVEDVSSDSFETILNKYGLVEVVK